MFCANERQSGGSSRMRWRRPRALETAVIAANPDVIHVNSLEFAPEIWLLRRALRSDVALAVQDHANAVPRSFSLKGAVRRRLLAAADAFLFTATEQSTVAHEWIHLGPSAAAQSSNPAPAQAHGS